MIKNETFTFTGLEGLNIFCRSWHPQGDPHAVLLLVHGYAEHSGRYQHVAEYFVELGYAVYALDLRGHGQSDGIRADVKRFEDYLADLKTFLNIARAREPGRSVFLIGHSMGGAIVTLFAARHGSDIDGLITSAAGIKVEGDVSPLLIRLSRIIAALVPRLPVVPLDVEAVSRDPEVVTRYRNDPFNYLGKVRARMGVQILRSAELVAQELPNIKMPILILHGTADRLCDPAGSQMMYDQVRTTDKALRFYRRLYHEIFNEPERERVFADVAAWLGTHVR